MLTANLTERVKQKALESGFASVGIARAEVCSSEYEHLTEWLRRGYQGSMSWMERNGPKREDPSQIIPNARSVVSVAMNYYTDTRHSGDPEHGKISRYAWGDDYHAVMEKHLDMLVAFLEKEVPGSNSRRYVDTGPVMDKAWAVRAGLGWLGKHTNVITKEYGSWVFLGEIITDIKLDVDQPIEDFCGTCTACLDACPTGAIVEPYLVDSNKCISYLTIEHRGPIDESLKPQFENWVYGCDICQDVCPWNRFQKATTHEAFQARPDNIAPPLEDLTAITKEEFSRRFKRSPIKRTKLEGLRRNAKAVLEGKR
ncbi:MAG: tRNA epoxyqueuosine(34) reductase QueG [Bacteroidota bacterium]